uniref:Uncharacterized protein n=1 Tax=Anopheles dirus TaxID=7168 RepID=A0A182NSY9_9DIPT
MVPHVIYCIGFVMLFFFLIFPTSEMESAGLTVNRLCAHYFAAEHGFIQYHMKATSAKLLLHATMPFAFVWFVWIMAWTNPDEFGVTGAADPSYAAEFAWNAFCSSSGTVLLLAVLTVGYWATDGWSNHPIAKQLQLLTTPTLPDWRSVATNINDEYRRDTKLSIRANAISTLIVTESWIIKTNLYVHNILSQSDALMCAYKIETKEVITDTVESAEFVNIVAKPLEARVRPFNIRIHTAHIRDLKDRVQRPIVVLPTVQFRSLTERFVEVFKEQVALNPIAPPSVVPDAGGDNCLACLQARPDVKLVKYCLDVDATTGAPLSPSDRCQPCACRPLWCVECLATWFASRQQRYERDSWLSKKTTCPMCRALFCVRDVCYLENRTPAEAQQQEQQES